MTKSIKGFTNNKSNVWGHCEEEMRVAGMKMNCIYKTRFRCDICRQFVCSIHHRQHVKNDHTEPR